MHSSVVQCGEVTIKIIPAVKITGADSSLPPVVSIQGNRDCATCSTSIETVTAQSSSSVRGGKGTVTNMCASTSISIVTNKQGASSSSNGMQPVPDPVSSSPAASTSVAVNVNVAEAKVTIPPSSSKRNECLKDIQRLTDEELEFDEFLMDAAEWL